LPHTADPVSRLLLNPRSSQTGNSILFDLLMLILLLTAFAGAGLFVRTCGSLTRSTQPPKRDPR